ncbi:MAG: hypothetical protein RL698_1284 [Pseudomonadota bacterium]
MQRGPGSNRRWVYPPARGGGAAFWHARTRGRERADGGTSTRRGRVGRRNALARFEARAGVRAASRGRTARGAGISLRSQVDAAPAAPGSSEEETPRPRTQPCRAAPPPAGRHPPSPAGPGPRAARCRASHPSWLGPRGGPSRRAGRTTFASIRKHNPRGSVSARFVVERRNPAGPLCDPGRRPIHVSPCMAVIGPG